MTLAERLAFYTAAPDANGCAVWTGQHVEGYGRLKWKGRDQLVSRLTWEEANGPIPEGREIMHRCDNPPCRTLEHLLLGTHAVNMADMVTKGRQNTLHGSAHGMAKLTDDQVRAILADHRFLREIAADYGMSISAISRIRRREKWAHL